MSNPTSDPSFPHKTIFFSEAVQEGCSLEPCSFSKLRALSQMHILFYYNNPSRLWHIYGQLDLFKSFSILIRNHLLGANTFLQSTIFCVSCLKQGLLILDREDLQFSDISFQCVSSWILNCYYFKQPSGLKFINKFSCLFLNCLLQHIIFHYKWMTCVYIEILIFIPYMFHVLNQ